MEREGTGVTGIYQSYVECVQVLYYMGLLRENENIKLIEDKIKCQTR